MNKKLRKQTVMIMLIALLVLSSGSIDILTAIETIASASTKSNTINKRKQTTSPRYYQKNSINIQESFEKIIPVPNSDIWFCYNPFNMIVHTYNIKDGETEEFLQILKPISSVQFFDEKLIISHERQIVCYDVNTKNELWSYNNNKLCYPSIYYLSNKRLLVEYAQSLLLFDIVSGEILKEKTTDTSTSILKHNEYVVCELFSNNNTFLQRIDPNTFELIWEIKDVTDWHGWGGGINSAFIFEDSLYYYRNKHTFIYLVRINLKNGEIIWEKEVFDKVISINQNSIIIWGQSTHFEPDKKFLIALDRFSGEELWKTIFPAHSVNFGFQNNEYIYLNCNEYYEHSYLICINLNTGGIEQKLGYKDSYLGYFCNYNSLAYHSLYNKNDKQTCIITFAPAADSLTFQINQSTYKPDNDDMTEMDSKPTILQDRTYLPARYVCEPLGGQVFWDGDERKVTCKLVAPDNAETEDYKENIVELWIGKSTAKVNGVEVQIDPDNPDVVPTIINDRTMVPMRFLAESLGCSVKWIADTKEIILTYSP